MKLFKFFWICSNLLISFLLIGCTSLTVKPFSFTTDKTEFMERYCHSGKQIRPFNSTVLYFSPKIESGLNLDKANLEMRELERQRISLLKDLFFILSNENSAQKIANHGDTPSWYLLSSENEQDVLENIKIDNSTTKFRLFTFIVRVKNKIIIYQSNFESQRVDYNKSYSTDLNYLFSNYTMLAPKEVMEQITDSEFDPRFLYRTIILNENGEVNISKAIEQREDLWKAYINRFTSIKEASDQNSQKSTIELSLDLAPFCKYGRKISDLQSQ